jgi:hypothetical protein
MVPFPSDAAKGSQYSSSASSQPEDPPSSPTTVAETQKKTVAPTQAAPGTTSDQSAESSQNEFLDKVLASDELAAGVNLLIK